MPARQDRLDWLFSELSYGRLTPDAAEELAEEENLGPLVAHPDLEFLDPSLLSRWSLAMTVSWIVWRNIDCVMEQDNRYRAATPYWVFRQWRGPSKSGRSFEMHEGWNLASKSPASIAELRLEEVLLQKESATDRPVMRVHQARDALWTRLANGELVGEAIKPATGEVVEIPGREWEHLLEGQAANGEEHLMFPHLPANVAYRDARLRRSEVLSAWTGQRDRKPATSDLISNCRKWLEAEMRESQDVKPYLKGYYRGEASKRFKVGRRQFDAIWSGAIKTTGATAWSQPGRRKKSSR